MPGGVNSPVRAFGAVGRNPLFIDHAKGSYVYDVDGNKFIDYVCSWGPGILGHSHPEVLEEVVKAYYLLIKENINPKIINARFIKPLDKDMIEYVAKRHKQIIVVEEAIKKGGYGEAVSTYVQENCLDCNVKIMAIEDCFVEQGLVDELREKIGISSKKIYEKVKELV